MPFQNNILAGASGATGYEIPYSLRFRYSNNASLSRTAGASPTNDKIYTWSGWIKLAYVAANPDYGILFSGYTASNDTGRLTIRIYDSSLQVGGWGTNWRITSAVFRDPSAWYHVVIAFDTTNATANDRIKIYVNGTQITAFSTLNNPALNATTGLNNASTAMRLGLDAPAASAYHFDGYMAEVNFIDGQALTPSSFGQTDATTGVWVPKKYSGAYGTNGFYLKFNNATTTTTIGNDSSGNANNFTTSGISVTSGVTFDQMTDSPTLGYPVWSPIDKATVTVSEGNTAAVPAADVHAIRATMALPSSGKWYWEVAVSALGYGTALGIANNASNLTANASSPETRTYQFGSWFNSFNGGVVQYGTNQNVLGATNWTAASQPAANDVIMVAVDMDNGSMWVGRNGTWFNSSGTANPATNTDPRWTGLSGTTWFPYMAGYGTATPVTCRINSGQRAFAYTPPSGFKALNTTNLPTPSIKKGNLYMDATLRTGTGATASVSSLGFQPDLVWIKGRSGATDHGLYDSARGVQKQLESNQAAAETTETTGLTAFNSNGYTVGALAQLNTSAATYVDWAWKEGVTPGFDSFVFSGNATNRTVSHGLGAVPHFMIFKNRNTANGWIVYHRNQNASPATGFLQLQSNAAFISDSTVFNNTAPTSSVFSLGTDISANGSGTNNIVTYLWSEIEGFSKISSYIGNGSTDGPFVFCGFRPRYVLIKSTGAENWSVQDSARNPFNVVDARLKPNSADAEAVSSVQNVDFLSNGFKIRTTDPEKNGSGTTYIFAAYAENPFKYARAR